MENKAYLQNRDYTNLGDTFRWAVVENIAYVGCTNIRGLRDVG
jgi:hypothetical protein